MRNAHPTCVRDNGDEKAIPFIKTSDLHLENCYYHPYFQRNSFIFVVMDRRPKKAAHIFPSFFPPGRYGQEVE